MKTPPLNLTEHFNKVLQELLAAEKKYQKCFSQLAQTAYTDELRSALSPAGTEIESHISRLTQIVDLLKLKGSRITSALDDELLKMGKEVSGFVKQQSILKDIEILHCAQVIEQVKIANYQSLYQMAHELKIGHAEMLLEQSLKDNQNTYGYLNQIAQNIIYPKAESN